MRGPVFDYGDVWREGGLGPGGFLKEGFSGRVRDGYGGTVSWRNDSAGFRRVDEVTPQRTPGSLRILSLGDSFTGGYRVGEDEVFSRLLERHLEATGHWSRVEVLASVIEEPPTGLLYLETRGLQWHPDLVLLGVTLGNDLGQTFVSLAPRGELRLDRALNPRPSAPIPRPTRTPWSRSCGPGPCRRRASTRAAPTPPTPPPDRSAPEACASCG